MKTDQLNYIFIVALLFNGVVQPTAVDFPPGFQSLVFTLPHFCSLASGICCREFSDYFCLLGYLSNRVYSDRPPSDLDLDLFWEMVEPLFQDLNWFSFSLPRSNEDYVDDSEMCCGYQTQTYVTFGQRNGMSPEEYLLKARFKRHACFNLITAVGFGPGPLQRAGRIRHNASYAISLPQERAVYLFSYEQVQSHLSFTWFKSTVICKDQPWICEEFI
ncbi:uncharacterized protein LOC142348781 isoform X2 [Convolutriloba macropyga]|uniref:uncharacterized protein LOC142348781 isoform X2 n=1 Tax=Convolutriloba macropyga TaxID=536237 RepID=UPI003F524A90